jgi:hypothetical protein
VSALRAAFTPRTWNHPFCSAYRGKCYRRAMNASYRRRPLIRGEVGPDFHCAECDKLCSPGLTVAAHATKFCGRKCKRLFHSRLESAARAGAKALAAIPEVAIGGTV